MIAWKVPYLTADLPGIGGVLRQVPEDFIVEEIPAYEPQGEGEHTFFMVEKRNLPTMTLARDIARALHVAYRSVGFAGLKDTRAVARQMFSVFGIAPDQVMALELEQARVLWAKRHTNKLRTGHSHGNRFTIRVRNVVSDAEARIKPIFEILKRRGVPNGYGVQRFGRRGDNADVGLLILQDKREMLRERGVRKLSRRMRRFLVSALQSALFNQYLATRMEQATMDDVLKGDIAKKQDTGGMFVVEDVPAERARVRAWEISPTGPIYGYKMWAAADVAGRLEQSLLASRGLKLEEFRPVRMKGSRRPLRYAPIDLEWGIEDADLVVRFAIPKGSFATMLLREVLKTDIENDGEGAEDD